MGFELRRVEELELTSVDIQRLLRLGENYQKSAFWVEFSR